MPLSGGEQAAYRTTDQVGRCYVWVVKPETTWTGRMNGTLTTGTMNVWFDVGVLDGTYPPEEHFTLLVGTSAGARDKGVVRYKSGAANGTGTLVLDKNEVEWADGDYLTLIQEIRPWAITPSLDGTLEDETKTYSDQNENMHPLTWVGPPGVAFLDAAAADILYWSDADLTHCGGSISGTVWTWYDGIEQGAHAGTEIDPKIARYTSTGTHLTKCVKTHSNGKTHTRYTYSVICARSGSDAPYTAIGADISGSADVGSRATITGLADATETDFPDGAMVIVFTETWYAGVKAAYGGNWTFRENVKFVGWISGDSVKQDPDSGEVSFDAVAPTMMNLACWPANIHDDGSAEWHRITSNTPARTMFHLVSEHSTIDLISDVHLPTSTKTLRFVDIAEGTLWEQLRTQVGGVIGTLVHFDSQGALYLEPDIQILPLVDRSGIDVMFTVASTDWLDFTLSREEAYTKEAQNDFAAFYYDASSDPKPWFSLAPSRQHSYGAIGRERGIRADTQTESNTLAGLYHAQKNAEFQDCNLKMAGQWFCFDVAPQRFFTFTLTGTETERGLVWSGDNAKMIPRGYKLTWNTAGHFESDVTFAQSVSGPSGGTGNYPGETVPPPNPPAPPLPWDPSPPLSGGGEVVGVCGTGGFCWSINARTGTPTVWQAWTDGLGDSSELRSLANDPNTSRSQYGASIDGAGNIYTSLDWRGVTVWSLSLSTAQAKVLIDAAIGDAVDTVTFSEVKAFAQDLSVTYLLASVSFRLSDGTVEVRVLRSSNWGSSWAIGSEIPGYGTSNDWFSNRKFDVGLGEMAYDIEHGRLYICAASPGTWGPQARSSVNYSANWGSTWADPAIVGGGQVDRTDPTGPSCAKCDTNGLLYIVPWQPYISGAGGAWSINVDCLGCGSDLCWDPAGDCPFVSTCPRSKTGGGLDPLVTYTLFASTNALLITAPFCAGPVGVNYSVWGRVAAGPWNVILMNLACTPVCSDSAFFSGYDELRMDVTGTTISPSMIIGGAYVVGGQYDDPFGEEPVIASANMPINDGDFNIIEQRATGDEYARYRGMFELAASNEWFAAQIETPDSPNSDTKLYLEGNLKATISRPLRQLYGYPGDKMLMFFGRSWFTNEEATGTYPELFYRSTTKLGSTPTDASGNLYTLSMRSITGIIAINTGES